MGDFILGSVGVVGDVTGVKGDKEVSYRSGNVNLTPANIGALDVDNVYNGLDKTAAGYVLDARQGKVLAAKLDATQSDIAIIIEGNQTTHTGGAAVGEYVIVRNSSISGITDGLYKAVQAIPANTAIDSTYLETVDGGGLNELNGNTVQYFKGTLQVEATFDNSYYGGATRIRIPLSVAPDATITVNSCTRVGDATVYNITSMKRVTNCMIVGGLSGDYRSIAVNVNLTVS